MTTTTQIFNPLPSSRSEIPMPSGYLGPAEVLESNPNEPLILITWSNAGQPCRSWARAALATTKHLLHPGDTVLVLSQNLADFYIIGVLESSSRQQLPHPESSIQDPVSSASNIQNPASPIPHPATSHETLEVRSPRGEL